jgi:hypothetical protein
MIIDLLFDVCLELGFMNVSWLRWIMVAYSFGIFLWVLALSGAFSKPAFVALLLTDLLVIAQGIWRPLMASADTFDLVVAMSEAVWSVWLMSTLFVIATAVFRSTIGARMAGRMPDLLVNPKRRFLLPIGAWAAIIVLPTLISSLVPQYLYEHRFPIAAMVLVWGWVAMELPFILMEFRVHRRQA